jgi:RNA polymerase sigma factor (TIGR02999 family)
MRRILVEHARRKKRPKRGGGRAALPLEGLDAAAGAEADWVMLDDLMGQLAGADERAARLAELRIFGGMELAHAARLLGISEATAKRDWVYARAWLRERFVEDGTHGP